MCKSITFSHFLHEQRERDSHKEYVMKKYINIATHCLCIFNIKLNLNIILKSWAVFFTETRLNSDFSSSVSTVCKHTKYRPGSIAAGHTGWELHVMKKIYFRIWTLDYHFLICEMKQILVLSYREVVKIR